MLLQVFDLCLMHRIFLLTTIVYCLRMDDFDHQRHLDCYTVRMLDIQTIGLYKVPTIKFNLRVVTHIEQKVKMSLQCLRTTNIIQGTYTLSYNHHGLHPPTQYQLL